MKLRLERQTKQKINPNSNNYKNIFMNIPELHEQTGGNLEKMVNLLRKIISNQIDQMKTEWERASGEPMSEKQNQLVFNNPQTLANVKTINNLIDYIDHIDKANKIAESESFNLIAALKKSRSCRNGGIKRAEVINEARPRTKKQFQNRFDQIKKRSPGLSKNAICIKISEEFQCSSSHVYKILTDYYS